MEEIMIKIEGFNMIKEKYANKDLVSIAELLNDYEELLFEMKEKESEAHYEDAWSYLDDQYNEMKAREYDATQC